MSALKYENQHEESPNTEDEKKNSNFIQLYRDNISAIRWLSKHNATALEMFLFILEHMDHTNALACSYAVFEEALGKSKATVTRAVKVLKDNGFLSVLKMGTSNVYIINQEVAWSSWDNKKKYCKFNGNMLISHKENKDYRYSKTSTKVKFLEPSETEGEKAKRLESED